MKKSTVIIIVVIIAVAAFAGGMFYGKSSVSAQTAQNAAGFRGGFAGRNGSGTVRFGNGGGVVTGQVISKDSQSITLQLPNGNSQVVFYSPTTQISIVKTATGTANDLAAGTEVIVSSSTSNSDGSVTANMIQVRQGGGAGLFRGGN